MLYPYKYLLSPYHTSKKKKKKAGKNLTDEMQHSHIKSILDK